jgi:tRNA U34 2-thiouridine synthase MnmA/TrmU
MRGADATKDQSYFLSNTTEDALKRTLFPVGHLAKTCVPHACVCVCVGRAVPCCVCRAVCR